jgi:pimeloyl-ACP methyl ester carboxylesterase
MKQPFWMAALIALLLMMVPLVVTAQEPITLEPVTLDLYGIEALIPAGWSEAGPGLFARQANSEDGVLVAVQGAPLRVEGLLQALLPQLGLSEAPEAAGEVTTDAFTWTLYQVDVEVPGSGVVRVDLALAQGASNAYVVLVQSLGDEYDVMHEQVFLPVLESVRPLAAPEATEPADQLFTSEDVTFAGGADDVMLAGTLTLPEGPGPYPAIVLVSGSGPQDRDETIAGTDMKPFLLLANQLTPAGVAVLRYDDRGVGQSTGDFNSALTSDFTADAAAALAYLATRDDIAADQIGVLGHSEGGLVASQLGAQELADFIISLAGPGVTGVDLLLQQNRRLYESEGATDEQAAMQVAMLETVFPLVIAGDLEAAEQAVREASLEAYATFDAATQGQFGSAEQYADLAAQQVMAQVSSPWFIGFLTSDPAPDWAQTTVPVLAIFGGLDVQVDAEQNAPAVEAALAEAGNADVTIVVLPDANHLFQSATTGGVSEYSTLPAEFTPDLIPTILNWLAERVTLAG